MFEKLVINPNEDLAFFGYMMECWEEDSEDEDMCDSKDDQ